MLVKIYYLGSTPSVCSRSHGRFSPSLPLALRGVEGFSLISIDHIIISQFLNYNSSSLAQKNIISRHI